MIRRISLRPFLSVGLLVSTLILSGCESAEEKAERHYQSALSLLEVGDHDRAMVELRNVFQLNGLHKEARQAYVRILLDRGNLGEATGQLLRLVEQYPDTLDARQKLAELALARGDWAEFERHGQAAVALDAAPAANRAIAAALAYRVAVLTNALQDRAAAVDMAREVLAEVPGNRIAQRVVIDALLTGEDPANALPEIDKLLVQEPDSEDLHMLKFRLLAQQADQAVIGAQLREMHQRFPENATVRDWLLSWYLSQKDMDGAEAYLRGLAGADDGPIEGHLAVTQMLEALRSPEAARAELARLAEANKAGPTGRFWRALGAVQDYNTGDKRAALTEMEDILKGAPADDQTRRIKVMLAQILQADGNPVGARARVEEVLAEDPSHVEALKMRAAWRIAEDKPGDAIVDLRTALNQAPRDSQVLTLMAAAHEREGAHDLAGERLALAVEMSSNAPEESLRYARFLLRDGMREARVHVAESVLTDARRASPSHVGVLALLGDIHVANRNEDRVREVIAALQDMPGADAAAVAQRLETALVLARGQNEESLAFLQGMIAQGSADSRTVALMLDAQLRTGKPDEARAFLQGRLALAPEDLDLLQMLASVDMILGQTDAAEATYRKILALEPGAENPVRLYYELLVSAGREDEAVAVLRAARAANSGSVMLAWLMAGHVERSGDIDAAIAIYEELYVANTDNTVIANNLASLITAHRDDSESLERAFVIARRLRGLDVPAFQDTYGWIEFRRGNIEEAIRYLEPGAAGLPGDPLAQFHLGMAYSAIGGREAEAIAALERALEIGADSGLPQMRQARQRIEELKAKAP
jgi:cellulose synthase operon protein C